MHLCRLYAQKYGESPTYLHTVIYMVGGFPLESMLPQLSCWVSNKLAPSLCSSSSIKSLADPGGWAVKGFDPPPPPTCKSRKGGSTQRTKLFLESGVKFTGNALYFYQKLIFSFFPGGMPLTPLVMVCLM